LCPIGIPVPRVEWRRNGAIVKSEVDAVDVAGTSGKIKSSLVLTPLKRSDWPLSLTCSAANSNLSRPLENTFDVDMERKCGLFLFWELRTGMKRHSRDWHSQWDHLGRCVAEHLT
jgi:hypothetical protein